VIRETFKCDRADRSAPTPGAPQGMARRVKILAPDADDAGHSVERWGKSGWPRTDQEEVWPGLGPMLFYSTHDISRSHRDGGHLTPHSFKTRCFFGCIRTPLNNKGTR
jgi:hypothetical protein